MATIYRLKACTKCGGDLNLDAYQEWTCLQCGDTDWDFEPEGRKQGPKGRRLTGTRMDR